jgi:large subunit ribosomal protein L14e
MGFARQVQVGRVVVMTYGPDAGKLAVITEIIDHGRVVVDGPSTGVKRQAVSFKRASLTPIVLNIPRGVGSTALLKKIKDQDLEGKWNKTSWARKIAKRSTRAALSDFDRFKLMLARKKKATIVNKAFAKSKSKK